MPFLFLPQSHLGRPVGVGIVRHLESVDVIGRQALGGMPEEVTYTQGVIEFGFPDHGGQDLGGVWSRKEMCGRDEEGELFGIEMA